MGNTMVTALFFDQKSPKKVSVLLIFIQITHHFDGDEPLLGTCDLPDTVDVTILGSVVAEQALSLCP